MKTLLIILLALFMFSCEKNLTGIPSEVNRSKIVFSSDRSGKYEIYSMNINGSEQIRLTNDANSGNFNPVFSPKLPFGCIA